MAGTYDMIMGLTLLASACLGVVVSALVSWLRYSSWFRNHRIFSIVMILVCYAGGLAVMWDWASSVNNFPATFGPFVLVFPAVAIRHNSAENRRRAVRPQSRDRAGTTRHRQV